MFYYLEALAICKSWHCAQPGMCEPPSHCQAACSPLQFPCSQILSSSFSLTSHSSSAIYFQFSCVPLTDQYSPLCSVSCVHSRCHHFLSICLHANSPCHSSTNEKIIKLSISTKIPTHLTLHAFLLPKFSKINSLKLLPFNLKRKGLSRKIYCVIQEKAVIGKNIIFQLFSVIF